MRSWKPLHTQWNSARKSGGKLTRKNRQHNVAYVLIGGQLDTRNRAVRVKKNNMNENEYKILVYVSLF